MTPPSAISALHSTLASRSARLLPHALLVGLLACAAACARSQSPVDAERDVKAGLESFYAAMGRGDAAGAMAVIAPDAMFIESGRLETRAEYEANHLPLDIQFEKQVTGKRTLHRVTIDGDTAWVIATTDFDGTFDGRPVSFVSSQLAVMSRQDGRWLIRSIHWSSR